MRFSSFSAWVAVCVVAIAGGTIVSVILQTVTPVVFAIAVSVVAMPRDNQYHCDGCCCTEMGDEEEDDDDDVPAA